MEIIEHSLDRLWIKAADALLTRGNVSAPRGIKTQEILGMQLILTDPRARLPLLPVRKFSLAYAMGELAWYLKGDDSVAFMARYAPSYGRYSDDGKRLHGAYGPRIFGCNQHYGDPQHHQNETQIHNNPCKSQWATAKELLQRDPDSRQAVISIYKPSDCGFATKDVPCTLTLQFLVRQGMLNLVVNMRSNDLWLGGLYDVFCFTALQELMAHALGISLGIYYHHVGSFHLYDKNRAQIEETINAFDSSVPFTPPVPTGADALEALVASEARIWQECGMDALESIASVLQQPSPLSLWQLGYTAWRWKLASSAADVKETSRRVVAQQLQEHLGKLFERCFH